MNSLIQRGLRRNRTTVRMGWFLLIAFTVVLIISMVFGIHSLREA